MFRRDHAPGLTQEEAEGLFATRELDNLQNTAVNTDIIPDTNATHDLGSLPLNWNNIFGRKGYLVYAYEYGSGVANVTNSTLSGLLAGQSYAYVGGVSTLSLSNQGGSALGFCKAQGALGATSNLRSGGSYGNFAFGSCIVYDYYGAGFTGSAVLAADAYYGSTAFGSSFTGDGTSELIAYGSGSLAFGYVNSYANGSLARVRADGAGSVSGGFINAGGGAGQHTITSGGFGAFALATLSSTGNATASTNLKATAGGSGAFLQGYAKVFTTGNAYLTSSGGGSFCQGFLQSQVTSEIALISSGRGSFSQGAIVASSTNNPLSRIQATGPGTFAQGYIDDTHNVGNQASVTCYIQSNGSGSFAQGSVLAGGQNTQINSQGRGSFAQGYVWSSNEEANAYIRSISNGSHASGFARSNSSGYQSAILRATSLGAFARGWVRNNSATDSAILSSAASGSTAMGRVRNQAAGGYATLVSSGQGALAFGNVDALFGGYDAEIRASGDGAFAGGNCINYNTATLTDISIEAAGPGSFAFGSTTVSHGSIYANGVNAFQFGRGSNTQVESAQFGSAWRHEFTYGQLIQSTTSQFKTAYGDFNLHDFTPDPAFEVQCYDYGGPATFEVHTYSLAPVPVSGFFSTFNGIAATMKITDAPTVDGGTAVSLWIDDGNAWFDDGLIVNRDNNSDADADFVARGAIDNNLLRTDASINAVAVRKATPTSTFDVYGSHGRTISETATSTTLTALNYMVTVDASGGARTITLPALSGITGRVYKIKKIDSSSNIVTVDANASETIDGALTFDLLTQFESIELQAGASEWHIL